MSCCIRKLWVWLDIIWNHSPPRPCLSVGDPFSYLLKAEAYWAFRQLLVLSPYLLVCWCRVTLLCPTQSCWSWGDSSWYSCFPQKIQTCFSLTRSFEPKTLLIILSLCEDACADEGLYLLYCVLSGLLLALCWRRCPLHEACCNDAISKGDAWFPSGCFKSFNLEA